MIESLQSSSEKPSAMDKNQNGSRIGFWIRIGIGNEVGIGSKDVSIVFWCQNGRHDIFIKYLRWTLLSFSSI